MKTIVVNLLDEATGEKYKWKIRKFNKAWNAGGKLRGGKYISGWEFDDHDGYTRCVEGNWTELVAAFRLTAGNYGLKTNIS